MEHIIQHNKVIFHYINFKKIGLLIIPLHQRFERLFLFA